MRTRLQAGGRRGEWQPGRPVGWVLLDVDGTLMGPTGAVTPAVVEAVGAVVDAGIAVGYATGRNVAGIADVHAQLGLAGPHVVLNGAQVRQGGEAVTTWPLADAQLADVLSLCERGGLYAELYTGDGFLVTSMDERFRPHWELVIGWPDGTVAERPPAPGEVIKATIVTLADADTRAVLDAVQAIGLATGPATSPLTPGMTFVNITRPDVDKGTAIRAAAAGLGIGLDRVVVVGDGANDLPMLAVAGTAIAMGDAPDAVKAQAHLVTAGVEEDGAALALAEVLGWHQAAQLA